MTNPQEQDKCKICESPNIKDNNYLNNFKNCYYCNFIESKNDISKSNITNINNKFIDLSIFDKINYSTFLNPACISTNAEINNFFIDKGINTFFSPIGEDKFDIKSGSKLLKNGKIDLLIIPDLLFTNLSEIFSYKELFSNNISIYVNVYNPYFILENLDIFNHHQYIYSLLSISKISDINKFDIYNMHTNNNNYYLLEIKRNENTNIEFVYKLQETWDDQCRCLLFHNE